MDTDESHRPPQADALSPSFNRFRPVPLLRVPPFPGSNPGKFAQAQQVEPAVSDEVVDALADSIRSNRVGGNYWGSQPPLTDQRYVLVRLRDPKDRATQLRRLRTDRPVLFWVHSRFEASSIPSARAEVVAGDCDPWHLLSGASAVITDWGDELALIAAIAGLPVECNGPGTFYSLSGGPARAAMRRALRENIASHRYFDPYSDDPITFADAIDRCAFWRRLIDGNRDIKGAAGFAFWKRATVAPLLWRGSEGVPFLSDTDAIGEGDPIALWKARTPPRLLSELERRKAQLIEVEDGFIRSVGLGADCVPPLSIVVDRLGAHFDPERPSELEELLQKGEFCSELLDRGRRLREVIVASGLSKYSAGRAPLKPRVAGRRHILVPGQVEDDRAVLSGGGGLTSNLELLRRVRARAPDAYIIYKPHPDVEAGHRTGGLADEACLSVADEIVRNEPISALIELVDEVHVNSSLVGFEGLLREKPVTTYGVPFYAGWGLTRDLSPIPARRTAKRSLDELVAAVLLLYPRYLDPVTGLPCPAEVLVRRLTQSAAAPRDGIVVRLRRLQGRCRRGLAALQNRKVKR